jgi:hypothetical protein
MKLTSKIAISTLFYALLILSRASYAEVGECQGILRQTGSELTLGGGEGEDESICLIIKSEQNKVLATCRQGHLCRVRGRVSNCKDVGECAEISNIVSVRYKLKK